MGRKPYEQRTDLEKCQSQWTKLQGNLRYAREILVGDVFAGTGVNIVPVLFNSSMGGPVYDKSEEHFDWVPIVDADSMKLLLEHLRTGQEGHFFQFLSNPTYGLTASSQPR
jgi:hypothetical protein